MCKRSVRDGWRICYKTIQERRSEPIDTAAMTDGTVFCPTPLATADAETDEEADVEADADVVLDAGVCEGTLVREVVTDGVAAAAISGDCTDVTVADDDASDVPEADEVEEADVVEEADGTLPTLLFTNWTTVSVVLVPQYERWAWMLSPVLQQIGSAAAHQSCNSPA